MDPQNSAAVFFRNDLGLTGNLSQDLGLAQGPEKHGVRADLVALLQGLGLGQADVGNLGRGKDGARHDAVIHVARSSHRIFRSDQAFSGGHVGQHDFGRPQKIPDGIHIRSAGFHPPIGCHPAFMIHLHTQAVEALKVGAVGGAADANQYFVHRFGEGLASFPNRVFQER